MGLGGSKLELNELSDGCNLPKIVKNIYGLSSNSTSPTDTWIIEAKDNVYYDEEKINSIFLKYFIDPYSLPKPNNARQQHIYLANFGLRYEVSVYRDVIRPLIDYGVCKNFVKYLGSGYICKRDTLIDALVETGSSRDNAENALTNSTLYMGNGWRGRPAIENNITLAAKSNFIFFPNKLSVENMSYTLLMNEVIPPNAITLEDVFRNNIVPDYSLKSMFGLWYELAYSCYCMSLSGLNHNDLHTQNIYIIPRTQPIDIRYKIEDLDPVVLFSDYEIKIFDFDRAYSERIGVNLLNTNKYLQKYGNTNTFVAIKDFYKVFVTYALNKPTEQPDILRLFCGDDMSKKGRLLQYMQDMNASFYVYNDNYIGDDFLNSLNTPLEFIKELVKFNPNTQKTQYTESYSVSESMFKDGKLILDTKDTDLEDEVKRLRRELEDCNNRVRYLENRGEAELMLLEPEITDEGGW